MRLCTRGTKTYPELQKAAQDRRLAKLWHGHDPPQVVLCAGHSWVSGACRYQTGYLEQNAAFLEKLGIAIEQGLLRQAHGKGAHLHREQARKLQATTLWLALLYRGGDPRTILWRLANSL